MPYIYYRFNSSVQNYKIIPFRQIYFSHRDNDSAAEWSLCCAVAVMGQDGPVGFCGFASAFAGWQPALHSGCGGGVGFIG